MHLLLNSKNLSLVLLEATPSEKINKENNTSEWEEVESFNSSLIIKYNKDQYTLNKALTSKLDSIKPSQSVFEYYKNTLVDNKVLDNYITTFYLRPALKNDNTNEIIPDCINFSSI